MTSPWLVVGLGNPGAQYEGNRHNVGAMVLAELARRMGGRLTSHKARASVLDGRLGLLPGGVPGPRVVLPRPATYMNLSGGPVAALAQFYGIDADHVVVLHDELDIPAHEVRIKKGGGEGGHNGLRSISSAIATKDYVRVRIGVGRPPGRQDPADYVLSNFPASDRDDLGVTIQLAADAVEDIVTSGVLAAQNTWNAKS